MGWIQFEKGKIITVDFYMSDPCIPFNLSLIPWYIGQIKLNFTLIKMNSI